MAKLTCEKCDCVNESGTLFCRKCGGKLVLKAEKKASKIGKFFKKFFKFILILVIIIILLIGAFFAWLLLATSGFDSPSSSSSEEANALVIMEHLNEQMARELAMTEGEANFLATQLMKKSSYDPKPVQKLEIHVNIKNKVVSTVVYSEILGRITRCELRWNADGEPPRIIKARFGKLFLPPQLYDTAAGFFSSRVIAPPNDELIKRIEKLSTRGNNQMVIRLAAPVKPKPEEKQ